MEGGEVRMRRTSAGLVASASASSLSVARSVASGGAGCTPAALARDAAAWVWDAAAACNARRLEHQAVRRSTRRQLRKKPVLSS